MSKRDVVTSLAIGLASVACVPRAHAAGQSCEQLAQLNLPNTKITSAETVAAGAFTPPANMTPSLADLYKQLPAFCRIKAVATPSTDSDINIEVWLPTSGWNGKFRGQATVGSPVELTIARSANRFRKATPLRRPTPATPLPTRTRGGLSAIPKKSRTSPTAPFTK